MSNSRFHILLLGVRATEFDVVAAIDRVEALFRAASNNVHIERCIGHLVASRTSMLDALARWSNTAQPTDACVLYYCGHAGRVRFTGIAPELDERPISYLTCESSGGAFSGILDRELSTVIAELDRRCPNVTTIIDACYSGTLVRDDQPTSARPWRTILDIEAPGWVHDVLSAPPNPVLAVESHPRVVRLSGTSPRRAAYLTGAAEQPELRTGPSIGMFTRALVDTLEDRLGDWHRLSWDTVLHTVRQRVISALRMEGQWVAFAGPRERLLFSTRTLPLPRTVGLVDGQWLRAGALQGVEIGDRWAFADSLEWATVEHVEINRARLSRAEASLRLEPSVAAYPIRMRRRVPLYVHGNLDLSLETSAWLEPGGPDSRHQLRVDQHELVVIDNTGEWIDVGVGNTSAGRAEALELLEDRARSQRLLERGPASGGAKIPVVWVLGSGMTTLDEGASLRAGEDLWVHLRNPEIVGQHWFVCVVLIDVAGRPWLLNASQPEGIELEPGDFETIGHRPGAARCGVVLDWPTQVRTPRAHPLPLLFVVSGRPIQLAHLIRTQPVADTLAFRQQGLQPTRAAAELLPELSEDWCCEVITLKFSPSTANGNGQDQAFRDR